MKKIIPQKWLLTYSVIPVVVFIMILKTGIHFAGWEFLTLNSLFSALISANVFLIGFLISGVLSDYKESEKIPTDIVSSLETIFDEALITYKNKKGKGAKSLATKVLDLSIETNNWFYKKISTKKLLDKVSQLNEPFLEMEAETQANFISRLKSEQNIIRKSIIRVQTIRETSFNQSGYAIAEIITFILCFGLLFTEIKPFYESFFFISFVSFILIYMISLIKDFDNPFGYYESGNFSAEVSLHPLTKLTERLTERYKVFKK